MVTDEKAKKIFSIMMDRGIIPKSGQFEINRTHINESFEIFKECFPRKSPNKQPSPSQIRYANKIAYLNLTLLNKEREEFNIKINKDKIKQKAGFLYIISNPVFSGYYKIGITKNIDDRLSSYQTYDPLRRYKIEHYMFVENMLEEEKRILKNFSFSLAKGEWISLEKVKEIFAEFKPI